jgi:chromosome segregation protein
MLLKSLEMQGFKSFPDKTVLTFGPGITAVVGPNGSGKSNISDAIRWVLGEQSSKSLRGSKMEDVVFNGTEQRRAVGFAEVSLVFDNSDRILDFNQDEVKVTRRYYRSGESEYLINNTAVRLKDIQIMFMDTGLGRDGYSIIGQGRIGDIVASKSHERREIFEEAAGIAKFRYRKNEAERRLSAAEDNLVRLKDILLELESRVGPLAQQAEKAKKFLEYAGEKRELEIGLWLHTLENSRISLRDLNSKLELARTQYDSATEDIEEIESEIESISQSAQLLIVKMEEIRNSAQSLEEQAAQCDSEAAVLRNDIFHNNESIIRIKNEIEQSQAGDREFEQNINQRIEAIESKKALIQQAQERQSCFEQELEGLTKSSSEFTCKMEELSNRASQLAIKLSDIRVKSVTNQSSLSEINLRISQLTESADLRAQQEQIIRAEADECEEAYNACCEKVTELQNAVKGYEMRFQSRSSRLEAAKQKADKLGLDTEEKHRRARLLEEMERSMEGFTQSVKVIMKQSDRGMLRGIHGPVTRLIETSAKTALAIETALGAATQNIVCETEEDAKRAIAYLKDNKVGRATFLPLSSVKGNTLNEQWLESQRGFVGIASDLVSSKDRYNEIVRSLLGRTVVANDLDCAIEIARRGKYRFRVVTLDGQILNAGGSMTGGSTVKSAGLLSRRAEIERIKEQAKSLEAETQAARELWKQAVQEAAAAEAELTGVRGELATVQEDRIRLEGELKRLKELAESHERAVTEFNNEIEKLNIRAEECKELLIQAENDGMEVEAEKAKVEAELEQITGGQNQLSERREQLSSNIAEIKLTILAYNKEIEAELNTVETLRTQRKDAAERVGILESQIDQLNLKKEDIERRIAECENNAAQLRKQASETGRLIEELIARRSEGEQKQTLLRQKSREKTEERERTGREIARLEEKQDAVSREADEVVRRLYEEYELTRMEAEAIAKPISDPPKASRRLSELKNKIRALGTVNVDAIEEYKEVSERYEFLSAQVKDIEVSRDELCKLINELTTQMRDIFVEQFNQINKNFGIVFSELFGGGKAELKLSDPNDILNSGIDMYVQPPGKVILNMDALSGGEKALVAIALFFAILKVSPSPFCVLDEIEAALDDVNVDRYAAYLRRMTENTQFIVITHRRGTMEEADVLYGVTMQERGVSKLLELRASEVEERLGIKIDKS